MSDFTICCNSEAIHELLKDNHAFALLIQIACRIKESPAPSSPDLLPGEARIGDYSSLGQTRSQYRMALARLVKMGCITTRTSNKGTFVRLVSDLLRIDKVNETATGQVAGVNLECHRERESESTADDRSQPGDQQEEVVKLKPRKKRPACPHAAIVDLYHELFPEKPRIVSWAKHRQASLRARWNEDSERQSLEWWTWFLKERFRASQFLMENSWADLEWVLRERNFPKVLEGRYLENRSGADATPKWKKELEGAVA